MSPLGAACLTWMALMPACSGPPPVVHSLTVSAMVDGEEPLSGVRVSASGHLLGETDAGGHLVTAVAGREGQEIALLAECPAGFHGPTSPVSLRLSRVRSLIDSGGALAVSVPCRPTKRQVAIVVSAPGLPGAPVLVDGTPRGRTDRDGVAHVLALAAPGDVLAVAVDPSGQTEPVPFHLTRSFRIVDADQVLVVADAFERERRPIAHPPRRRSSERLYRIQ
jgi:hypothetical protein